MLHRKCCKCALSAASKCVFGVWLNKTCVLFDNHIYPTHVCRLVSSPPKIRPCNVYDSSISVVPEIKKIIGILCVRRLRLKRRINLSSIISRYYAIKRIGISYPWYILDIAVSGSLFLDIFKKRLVVSNT